ncbi:MAG: hypothetical protein QOI35_2563 [Cryptosporangiaceae bacterium]|nr:hypothetical protein [Cryptosporangiaceae bacterium]
MSTNSTAGGSGQAARGAGRAARSAGRSAGEAAQSKPVRILGRIGLVAHGVVYLLIAYLAIRIAFGSSKGRSTDRNGALQTLAEQPGGKIVLWIVALGLFAFTIWQFAEAAVGWTWVRDQKKRLGKRIGSAAEAIVFGSVGVAAAKLATGGSGGGTAQNKTATAKVLAMPGGQVLVAVAGLAVIAVAAFLAYRGIAKKFTDDLDLSQASPAQRTAAQRLGQVGYLALGVAYGLVGVLIVVAAVRFDPNKATGLDAALKTLGAQPFGRFLLIVIGLGLAAFGVYRFLDARYRRA